MLGIRKKLRRRDSYYAPQVIDAAGRLFGITAEHLGQLAERLNRAADSEDFLTAQQIKKFMRKHRLSAL